MKKGILVILVSIFAIALIGAGCLETLPGNQPGTPDSGDSGQITPPPSPIPAPAPVCNTNGVCDVGETVENCADCQTTPAPAPAPTAPTCVGAGTVADGSCSLTDGTDCCNGKNYVTAYAECATGYKCGTAPAAPVAPSCGNGICETGEDSTTCIADCPAPTAP